MNHSLDYRLQKKLNDKVFSIFTAYKNNTFVAFLFYYFFFFRLFRMNQVPKTQKSCLRIGS